MPYITPPPILPTDVGTDFLLDIDEAKQQVEDHHAEIAREVAQELDTGEDQDEGMEYLKTGADANEAEHRSIELEQRGWDEYYQ